MRGWINDITLGVTWNLWYDLDPWLLRCLIFQIVSITTIAINIQDLITYQRRKYHAFSNKHTGLFDYSISVFFGINLSCLLLAVSNLCLLIFQQNGRHFQMKHPLCAFSSLMSFVAILIGSIVLTLWLIPAYSFVSQINCKSWNNTRSLVLWLAQGTLLLSIQHEHWSAHRERLFEWGSRYARVIPEEDYFEAKWLTQLGLDQEQRQQRFLSLDVLEYYSFQNKKTNKTSH